MILTAIICTFVVGLALFLNDPYKTAYRHGCVANANLVDSEYDHSVGLYTALYEYQYRNVTYTFKYDVFHEAPPNQLSLWWKSRTPDKAHINKNRESVFEKKNLIKLATIFVVTLVLAIFVPQLPMIFAVCFIACMLNKHSAVSIVLSVFIAIMFFYASEAWFACNVIDYSYWSTDGYTDTQVRLKHIDELNPEELEDLYWAYSRINEEILESRKLSKFPIIGQYADRHTLELETLDWPEEYDMWLSSTYRRQQVDEYRKQVQNQ